MKDRNIDPDLQRRIEDFVLSRLSDTEQLQLFQELASDPQVRQSLDREFSMESLFYRDAWPSDTECDAAVSAAVMPESEVFNHATPLPPHVKFTDGEWHSIIERALDAAGATAKTPQQTKRGRIFRFPRFLRYSVAAGLVLCAVLGGYIIRQNSLESRPQTIADLQYQEPRHRAIRDLAYLATGQLVGTIQEQQASVGENAVQTGLHQQIVMRLSSNTGVLVEPQSVVEVDSLSEQVAALTLTRGSAVFAVEKNRFEKFEVVTSLATIRVTGTSFSTTLDSGNNHLLVHVIEGSVLLTALRARSEALAISAGSSVLVTADSLVPVWFDTLNILSKRSTKLKELLQEALPAAQSIHDDRVQIKNAYRKLRDMVLAGDENLVEKVEEFIQAHPGEKYSEDLLLELGKFYEARSEYPQARDTYRRLVLSQSHSRPVQTALFRMAVISMDNLSDFDNAERVLTEYLELFPEGDWSEESLERLARIKLIQNQPKAVAELLEDILRRYPTSPGAAELAYQCAHAFRIAGDEKMALGWYARVFEQFPLSAYREAALYWAGWCLSKAGVKRKANRYYTKYLELYANGEWADAIARSE